MGIMASGLTPAQVENGQPLLDAFRFMSDIDKFSDQHVQGVWREAWALKERANRHHFYSQRSEERPRPRAIPARRGIEGVCPKSRRQPPHKVGQNRHDRGNFTQFLFPGADRWFRTTGEKDPAASTEIQTTGHAGRPLPMTMPYGPAAPQERPYAQATREPTEPRQSLRD